MMKRYECKMVFDVELFLNSKGEIIDFTLHPLSKELVLL